MTQDQQRVEYFEQLLQNNPALAKQLQPRLNRYIPHTPHLKQCAFLCLNDAIEVFFGGAGGGGKSDALLMGALQYVDLPGYNALVLRRTYGQLNMPDSILNRAHEWLRTTDANWEAKHNRYQFPSGAMVQFGYLLHDKDVFQYDGPSFHYICFDELTQFTEYQYRFLFARLRRLVNSEIPQRMRSASNPGGIGHVWVKDRFIKKPQDGRIFIPASMEDNPHLDIEQYRVSLSKLDPVTRAQRERGDWDVTREGTLFKRHWFTQFADASPVDGDRARFWDMAASQGKGDWAVGTKICRTVNGMWIVEDVKRVRLSSHRLEELILSVTRSDGVDVQVTMEQEPGSSGKTVIDNYRRKLAGYRFTGIPSTGEKSLRWLPFAGQCEAGNVVLRNGEWNEDWLEEICSVPECQHDDQADSVCGAFNFLATHPRVYFGISTLGAA